MGILDKIKNHKLLWLFGLLFTILLLAVPVLIFIPGEAQAKDTPQVHMPVRKPATDHSSLLAGPFETGSDVTRACLECHEDAGHEVVQTVHWTWQSDPVQFGDRPEPVAVGKKNLLNNYCIGIQSNWTGCTSCHAGYGWSDANFDFSNVENVDCLICHDQSGQYVKTKSGLPVEGVDLVAAAKSVSYPTRNNCGGCHFNGGGGNGVKPGDLDEHFYYPSSDVDVHMGAENFLCIDCHRTEDHVIRGRSTTSSVDQSNQVQCTDCHSSGPHEDSRINAHLQTLACQTCHVPAGAVNDPTKMNWDWSTAGQDLPENPHEYLKIKGSFIYEGDFTPEYYWFNGLKDRYLLGDVIDPSLPVQMNPPAGDINDPDAKIYPFKVHRANQPYDTVNNYLLQPQTVGEYWVNFDWQTALVKGSEAVGLDYSGQFGFAQTEMYRLLSHAIPSADKALQCTACHSENGRLDWQALGYPGDPMEWGGRLKISAGK